MISASYTHEQYQNDIKRLTHWLRGRPWAGPDHAQDLVQDALLAALARQRKGLSPRALGWLARDAARLLPDRSRAEVEVIGPDGQKSAQRRKTLIRAEVEQQIDLATLLIPSSAAPDRLQAALELIQRIGSAQIQRAVQLVLAGADLTEAAAAVGMPATSLRRALAAIGRKLGAKPSQRRQDIEQMSLFAQQEEV